MRAEKPLRVGVIGCGGIAQMMHLPTLAERPDLFTIAALSDASAETLEAAGRRWSVEARHLDYRTLLPRADVDAVLLCASGDHQQPALESLAAGKHLFVEKPLAYSRRAIEAIGAAADAANKTLMVGYHKRYDPAVARAKALVAALEDLRFIEVSVLHPDDGLYRQHHAIVPAAAVARARSEAESMEISADRATRGAVASALDGTIDPRAPREHRVAAMILSESLVHDINLVRAFAGEPDDIAAAHVWRGGFAQSAIVRLPRDVTATLSWVAVSDLRHYEERLSFVGARGRVTLTFPSPYLRHAPTPLRLERMEGDELVVEERTVSYEEAFRAELHAFRRACLDGTAPPTDWRDAAADARCIERIISAWSR